MTKWDLSLGAGSALAMYDVFTYYLVDISFRKSNFIERELRENIMTLDLDISLFYFTFIGKVSSEISKCMQKKQSEFWKHLIIVDLSKTDDEPLSTSCLMNEYLATVHGWFEKRYFNKTTRYDKTKLFGYNLATFLMLEGTQPKRDYLKIFLFNILLIITTAFFSGVSWDLTATYYSMTLFFCGFNITLLQGVEILQSRVNLMKEMGTLLTGKGKLPQINIFDPISLRTWSNVRKLLMYQRHATMVRTSFFATLITVFFCSIIVLVIAEELGYITFMDLIISSPDSFWKYQFILESTIVLVLVVLIMWYGNRLNIQYIRHKDLVSITKVKMEDLLRFTPSFLGKNGIEPHDKVLKEGFKLMKEEFGEENLVKNIQERTLILSNTFEDILRELSVEERKNPFKVMGIPISNNIIRSIYVGLFSLTVSIIQKIVTAENKFNFF